MRVLPVGLSSLRGTKPCGNPVIKYFFIWLLTCTFAYADSYIPSHDTTNISIRRIYVAHEHQLLEDTLPLSSTHWLIHPIGTEFGPFMKVAVDRHLTPTLEEEEKLLSPHPYHLLREAFFYTLSPYPLHSSFLSLAMVNKIALGELDTADNVPPINIENISLATHACQSGNSIILGTDALLVPQTITPLPHPVHYDLIYHLDPNLFLPTTQFMEKIDRNVFRINKEQSLLHFNIPSANLSQKRFLGYKSAMTYSMLRKPIYFLVQPVYGKS